MTRKIKRNEEYHAHNKGFDNFFDISSLFPGYNSLSLATQGKIQLLDKQEIFIFHQVDLIIPLNSLEETEIETKEKKSSILVK